MRNKKLALNTLTSLIYQIVAVICGFILPKCILHFYGSAVNGLVSSINQFLHLITFLELGVGAVVQSSLYKPLYEKNENQVSRIWVSANKFFHRIAAILFVYVILLVSFYPIIVDESYGYIYTAGLIIAISISSFAQYYFGIVNQLLVTADQRGYVQYSIQILIYIVNVVVSVALIYFGASIQVVKLTTSIIFLIRPIFLYFYVKKNYSINKKITYNKEPIKQKWNGVAQHVSSVVLDSTDTIVLSLLSTLESVSVYSVYHLVIYGVKTLFTSMTNGIQALLGEICAKGDKSEINTAFSWVEWIIHTCAIFVFGCTGILIVPFVSVYTKGINDANYIVPIFAILITMAHGCHCIRLPYHIMIKAFGKYKETQKNYIIATAINVVVSVVTVKLYGLVGVAIGTLVAMIYQTIWMAWFNSTKLDCGTLRTFFKQISVDVITVASAAMVTSRIGLLSETYYAWTLLAVIDAVIWLIIIALINCLFYKKHVRTVLKKVRARRQNP